MSSKPFAFKYFKVTQDKCAMKIGTDGVLLGAWSSLEKNPFSILDIGAGTGILSLMLAQRSRAQLIDAIEIDDQAYEQCVENFEQSPWGDRLFCYHASLEEFAEDIEDKYDLIIYEYGPGLGTFSDKIIFNLKPNHKLVIIENSPYFFEKLNKKYQHLKNVIVVFDSVSNIIDIKNKLNHKYIDDRILCHSL